MRNGIGLFVLLSLLAGCGFSTVVSPADAPRMSRDELKAILGRTDLVVIDVRTGRSWEESHDKIKGAIREDPQEFKAWVNKYPKDKTYVLY